MTTTSNTAEAISSEESVTNVHEEEQNNGKVIFQIYFKLRKKIKIYNIIPCINSEKKHSHKYL